MTGVAKAKAFPSWARMDGCGGEVIEDGALDDGDEETVLGQSDVAQPELVVLDRWRDPGSVVHLRLKCPGTGDGARGQRQA
jgi:hypothetical protein